MSPRVAHHDSRLPAGALLVLLLLWSAPALAAQEFSTRLFGGYGPTNGYGAGVGADVGVQFPLPFLIRRPVFVGVWGVYHAGGEFLDDDSQVTVDQRTVQFGVEVAGIWLEEPIFLRGSGIVGAARISRDVVGVPGVDETSLLLNGGITIGKRLGHFFVGVEPSFPLVIGSDLTGSGFVLYATVGYLTGQGKR